VTHQRACAQQTGGGATAVAVLVPQLEDAAVQLRVGLALHSRRTTLGQQAHGGVTSRASSCNSCSSWYKTQIHSPVAGFGIQTVMTAFNIVVGADRLAKYRPRCRSPTAVNLVKADVLQMLLHTSVLSPPAAATCSSLPNSSPMTSAGRKHSACVLRQTRPVDDVVFGVRRLQTYRLDVPAHGL